MIFEETSHISHVCSPAVAIAIALNFRHKKHRFFTITSSSRHTKAMSNRRIFLLPLTVNENANTAHFAHINKRILLLFERQKLHPLTTSLLNIRWTASNPSWSQNYAKWEVTNLLYVDKSDSLRCYNTLTPQQTTNN